MKGFTKNPFGKNARGTVDSPFDDEELTEMMDDVIIDPIDDDLDFHSNHYDNQYDSHQHNQYDAPVAQPATKKGKKKNNQTSNQSFNQSPQPNVVHRPPPPVAPVEYHPASTPFVMPPSSDANQSANQSNRPNYLTNVTNYFNQKKQNYSTARDPELAGQIDDPALRAREAELQAREQALAAREQAVRALEAKQPNWPFKFYPLLYHNIADDILPENKKFIQAMYGLWLFELVCLSWNLLAAAVDVFSGEMCAFGIVSLVENLFFCAAGLFGSWFLWYKVIYDASKRTAISSVSYGRFSCGFLMHLGWVCVMLSGVWAGDGILSVVQCIGKSAVSTAFMVIGTILWGLNFVVSGALSKKVYNRYKAGGGTFANLKADLTKHAAKQALSRA